MYLTKNKLVTWFLLLFFIFSFATLSAESTQAPSDQTGSTLLKKGVMLFFLNPNGRPCQIQANILHQHREKIEQRYNIKALMTTNRSDHALFYKYGVRSLPSIILLKPSGDVHLRLPPGIQDSSTILTAIQ